MSIPIKPVRLLLLWSNYLLMYGNGYVSREISVVRAAAQNFYVTMTVLLLYCKGNDFI